MINRSETFQAHDIQFNKIKNNEVIGDLVIKGTVTRGIGLASGIGIDNDEGFPGTIALQLPFFEKQGVPHTANLFKGTINVNISPMEFRIINPDYEINDIQWSYNRPEAKESFWLVNAHINAKGNWYGSYIYYPLPSEVKSHPNSTMEILTEEIPDLHYGDNVQVSTSGRKISLHDFSDE